MHIQVIFGSKSDAPVFEPLCQELQAISGISVSMEVCSAHRDPSRLQKIIAQSPCELFITGAGLAAHLPGVVASQTTQPVIGIPCNDILNGMDALLSTLQMPRGVPVLSAGVESITNVSGFIKWYVVNRNQPPVIHLQYPTWAESLAKKFRAPLENIDWKVIENAPDVDHPPSLLTLVLADLLMPPSSGIHTIGTNTIRLGAPICAQPPYTGDLQVLERLVASGGLWVGINNVVNLQIALLQLWQCGRPEALLLHELRSGEKQGVS